MLQFCGMTSPHDMVTLAGGFGRVKSAPYTYLVVRR